jgi:hypothetical protein
MGLPGLIHIKIDTVFDEKNASVSRTLRYIGGWGLNCLASSDLGSKESWGINKSIVEDTIGLEDGVYALDKKHVGPGYYDYKWSPVTNEDEGKSDE